MDRFGEIKASLSRGGITVDDFDRLIGCTTLTRGYTVVSNHTRHDEKIPGLRVVNWS
jgi:tRNA(fMet)-specific endonuclease VapC